jgi:hypothetical protein
MRSLPVISLVMMMGAVVHAAEPVVRIAVVHEGELLGSEKKALAAIEKKLTARKLTVRLGDASAGEAAAMVGDPAAAPDEWRGVDVAVVLQILPPTGTKPSRISRGLGALVVYRPPSTAAVWRETVEGAVDVGMPTEQLEAWLASAIAVARGAK